MQRMKIYYCPECNGEIWAEKRVLVSCRCGKPLKKAAEGESFTDKRGREYLQILLPLKA